MQLAFGFTFDELRSLDGLERLDAHFLNKLKSIDIDLYNRLLFFRNITPNKVSSIYSKQYSELLIDLASFVDNFLAKLFCIEDEVAKIRKTHTDFNIIYECKRKFIQRIAVKKYPKSAIKEIEFAQINSLLEQAINKNFTQSQFALKVIEWLTNPDSNLVILDIAAQYAAYMVYSGNDHVLYSLPTPILPNQLLDQDKLNRYKNYARVGFDYSNKEFTRDNILNQAHYCIYCHKQEKDSCKNGLPKEKKNGCPLRQKISEMNYLKSCGFNLASLAVIVIDNPMVAATGYRICNDCVQACIYQKQTPVDVPIVESDILRTVLEFSYGIEIYLLLTKWNPLNIHSYLPRKPSGYSIMVVGLGPAGFSLAHYLLNDGHNVVAIDGLKITELPPELNLPIKNWNEYRQKLSEKVPQGFGGVTEYGITPRWDKNNLTIIRLILERRANFKLYGSIRYGSNINAEQIFQLFDHIALCVGAGHPKIPDKKNILVKGVKTAADFLIALQSCGAYLEKNVANLQIRMPIAVIGCGLTAIDAAVEAFYYYPMQVKKFTTRYNLLVSKFGKEYAECDWTEEDKLIAKEFIEHAALFASTRSQEELQNAMQSLGGVTIYYRKNLLDSPAYKSNYQEIIHAIAAGVNFCENLELEKINVDEYDYLTSINFNGNQNISTKTMLIAIGTGDYLDQKILIRSDNNISYFGDCNLNSERGSVVHALANSKYEYHKITDITSLTQPKFKYNFEDLKANLNEMLLSQIVEINRLSENVVEITIHSPYAAINYAANQFFRLQNYTTNLSMQIEPIALTPVKIDLISNNITFIIANNGYSSSLCKFFEVGEYVSLMGPVGDLDIYPDANSIKTISAEKHTVILIGYNIQNITFLYLANILSKQGYYVVHFAAYDKTLERIYQKEIESSVDKVVWCDKESLLENLKEYFSSDKKNISRIICSAPAQIMQSINDVKNLVLDDRCQLICHINSSMQCMMSGICGSCVQPVTDSRNYIFTCMCKNQNADIIDYNILKSRLQQNSLFEKITR